MVGIPKEMLKDSNDRTKSNRSAAKSVTKSSPKKRQQMAWEKKNNK